MPKAAEGGSLNELTNLCYINIPGVGRNTDGLKRSFTYTFNNLPDITDTKSATYNDEIVIGRSNPIKTFSSGDNRAINVTIHLIVTKPTDIDYNISILRAIQSCVYTRKGSNGAPFIPPPICQLKCGAFLADEPLCVILKSYNLKADPSCAWDERTLLPYKLDIDTAWEVVYKSSNLPGQDRIMELGTS